MIYTRPDIPQKVWDLMAGACEDSLSNDELQELESQLLGQPDRQRALLDYCGMHAELFLTVGIGQTVEQVRNKIVGGPRAKTLLHFAEELLDTDESLGELLQSARQLPVRSLTTASSTAWRRSPMLVFSLVACAFYGAFVLLAWNLRSSPNRGESTLPATASAKTSVYEAEAELTRADDAEWRPQADAADRVLQVRTGLAELQFAQGARVIVRGPAEFAVQSKNSGYLRHGKLVAMVSIQAIGFTIETPTAQVVDLGTEFAVDTDPQGATEVQVFTGKVELRPQPSAKPSSATRRSKPITLAAGTARRIESNGSTGEVTVSDVAFTPDRFPRLPASDQVRQIQVEGAFASSTHPALNVDDLIRGRGMKGDSHSADWHGTMWHSNYHDTKNVFVLFDLARPYRIHSMKVWNFNDTPGGRFARLGVKQGDVYVSVSGKGDPLSKPEDWKLIAADQQFAPGTGKDDYATPTIIPVGDVVARFAAIVVDDALAYGPYPNDKTPDVVGLSEVQFFGRRLESPGPQREKGTRD